MSCFTYLFISLPLCTKYCQILWYTFDLKKASSFLFQQVTHSLLLWIKEMFGIQLAKGTYLEVRSTESNCLFLPINYNRVLALSAILRLLRLCEMNPILGVLQQEHWKTVLRAQRSFVSLQNPSIKHMPRGRNGN